MGIGVGYRMSPLVAALKGIIFVAAELQSSGQLMLASQNEHIKGIPSAKQSQANHTLCSSLLVYLQKAIRHAAVTSLLRIFNRIFAVEGLFVTISFKPVYITPCAPLLDINWVSSRK